MLPHIAALKGFLEIATTLLLHNTHVDAQNKDSNTPLHLAVLQGRDNVVGVLLEHNARVDAQNKTGDMPLRLAITHHGERRDPFDLSIIKLLLENKANPNIEGHNKRTALHTALRFSEGAFQKERKQFPLPVTKSIIELLLNYGADPCVRDDQGKLPQYWAGRLRVGRVHEQIKEDIRSLLRCNE